MKSWKGKIPIAFYCTLVAGCVPPAYLERPGLPSLEYTRNVHAQRELGPFAERTHTPEFHSPLNKADEQRASLRFVKDYPGDELPDQYAAAHIPAQMQTDNVSNMAPHAPVSYQEYRAPSGTTRPYRGPLQLGEPGVTSSLWRETSQGNNLFRDHRAFQPMDLITIMVSEQDEGSKEADTEVSKESSFLAGIANFFNFELDATASNPGLDTSNLVNATMASDFEAEGETTRKGSLSASISAMVVEVLPSGVMRIEGEKIISVNNEEQIMLISGLVRQRDVNSDNEVMSSKIANLRIDYFGRGALGEAQYVGWFTRILHNVWPF